MDQADLSEAVARAIYEAAPITPGMQRASWEAASHPHVHVDRDLAPAAAAAIRVVLAEARQSIEALEGLEQAGNDYWHGWIAHEAAVLAVLAALEPPLLV